MRVAHRADHRALLRPVGSGRQRQIDAVVVPTNRSAVHLLSAAEVAARLDSVLVVLSSDDGPAPMDVAATVTGWPHLRWETVRMPADQDHSLVGLATTRAVDPADNRHGLLGVKRSVGLQLGRLLGWRTVLFLDDDISGLEAGLVQRAASGLDRLDAVGLAVRDWPDNSVVCHANRLGGGDQHVFVGGSALLVDIERSLGFFPTVYNEDWLFLADAVRRGAVGCLGTVRQTRRDPFADPFRARSEEFGEVVAEGLMDGLHRGLGVHAPVDEEFWAAFLPRRHAFVTRAAARLERLDPATAGRTAALACVDAARARLREITARSCAAYVRDWRTDLAVWSRRLADLPRVGTLERAVDRLDLRGSDEPLLLLDGGGRE